MRKPSLESAVKDLANVAGTRPSSAYDNLRKTTVRQFIQSTEETGEHIAIGTCFTQTSIAFAYPARIY